MSKVLRGKRYSLDPYDMSIRVYTDRAAYERAAGVDCARLCGSFTAHTDGSLYLGWFDGALPTLVHECVHAGMYVLGDCGIDPRHDTGEALCFLTDHLFGRIYKDSIS